MPVDVFFPKQFGFSKHIAVYHGQGLVGALSWMLVRKATTSTILGCL